MRHLSNWSFRILSASFLRSLGNNSTSHFKSFTCRVGMETMSKFREDVGTNLLFQTFAEPFELLLLFIPDPLAGDFQLLMLLLLALVNLLLLTVDHGGEVVVVVLHQRRPLHLEPLLLLLLHKLVLERQVLELLLLLLLQQFQVAQLLKD